MSGGVVCPTCGHLHPGGVGVNRCLCDDCFLLFGPTPYEMLAPEYQDRFEELLGGGAS